MADINQIISLGIGSPSGIQEFLTFGLQMGAAAVTPDCRTYAIGADGRIYVIPAESRVFTIAIGADGRIYVIPAESRVFTIPEEDRTDIIKC